MAENLSVEQTNQLNSYLRTHKNVSRDKAVQLLFGNNKTKVTGLKVEHSKSTQTSSGSKTNYNLNAKAKQQGEKLAADLYKQIQGASLNRNTLALLKQITPENVLFVLDKYSKITKGKESLAQAIDNEWGLDETTVKEYLCPALVKLAKNKGVTGIYYGDFMKAKDIKSLNKWIENSKNKIERYLKYNPKKTTVTTNKPIVTQKQSDNMPYVSFDTLAEIYENQNIRENSKWLTQKLYKQIRGLSNPSKTRKLLDWIIDGNNVIEVMKEYERLSGKETLINDVSNEYGLNTDDLKKLGSALYGAGNKKNLKLYDLYEKMMHSNDKKTVKQTALQMYEALSSEYHGTSLKPYMYKFIYWHYSNDDEFKTSIGVSKWREAFLNDSTMSPEEKINMVKAAFTHWAQYAKECNTDVSDILENAKKDLQEYIKRGDWGRYVTLCMASFAQLENRTAGDAVRRMGDGMTGINAADKSLKPDGKINHDFAQGNTGDCWLLSSIKAIARNSKGLKILNNSLKVNPDGSVTIHLNGPNKTYTITRQEIDNSIELSSGDGDVRALEIAVNRYMRENYRNSGRGDASIEGNREIVAFWILTGKTGKTEFYFDKNPIPDEEINNFNNPNQVTCVATRTDIEGQEVESTSDRKGQLIGKHAYCVTHSDSKYVYIINPWDTSNELKIEREKFKKLFCSIDKFTL